MVAGSKKIGFYLKKITHDIYRWGAYNLDAKDNEANIGIGWEIVVKTFTKRFMEKKKFLDDNRFDRMHI